MTSRKPRKKKSERPNLGGEIRRRWIIKPQTRVHDEEGYRRGKEKTKARKLIEGDTEAMQDVAGGSGRSDEPNESGGSGRPGDPGESGER